VRTVASLQAEDRAEILGIISHLDVTVSLHHVSAFDTLLLILLLPYTSFVRLAQHEATESPASRPLPPGLSNPVHDDSEKLGFVRSY